MKKIILLLGALFVTFHAFGAAITPKDRADKRFSLAQKLYRRFGQDPVQLQHLITAIDDYRQNGPDDELKAIERSAKLKGGYVKLKRNIHAKLNPTVPTTQVRRRLYFPANEELSDDEPSGMEVEELIENFWKMEI